MSESRNNLLKLINRENAIYPALTLDDVDISLPETVSVDGRDTKVTLTSKMSEDLGATEVVYYRRRPLPDYLNDDLTFDVTDVSTVRGLLPAINDRYGLHILPDDIENFPVAQGPLTVVADPDSHEWVGRVTLTIVEPIPLSQALPVTSLGGIGYPNDASDTKGQAYIYSYDLDATALVSWVPALQAGNADMSAFATALSTLVPEVWVNSLDSVPYNLHLAQVAFYDTPQYVTGANPKYKKVLGLTLSALCSNLQGTLLLNFR